MYYILSKEKKVLEGSLETTITLEMLVFSENGYKYF